MKLKRHFLRDFFLITVIFCLKGFDAHAQITIGSDLEPSSGVLLELKEQNGTAANNNVTASKGLSMPRIALTTYNDLSDISGQPDITSHIGLTVYNLNKCLNHTGDDQGIVVWNGSRWNSVKEEILPDNITYIQDREGNRYKTGSFGKAGTWMLENLRVRSYEDGTQLESAATKDAMGRVWVYPHRNEEWNPLNAKNSTYFDIYPAIGLLYNYRAATNNTNWVLVDQQQQPGDQPGPNEVETLYGHIQGICPNGWHLPSDREWNELEEEIANNPELYSTNSGTQWNNGFPSGTQGDNDWATTNTALMVRPTDTSVSGHGTSMKSPCEVPGNISGSAGGKSHSAINNGFDVLLVGQHNDRDNDGPIAYGEWAVFWTSSTTSRYQPTSGNYLTWVRAFFKEGFSDSYSGNSVIRQDTPRQNLYSIRCKKN